MLSAHEDVLQDRAPDGEGALRHLPRELGPSVSPNVTMWEGQGLTYGCPSLGRTPTTLTKTRESATGAWACRHAGACITRKGEGKAVSGWVLCPKEPCVALVWGG